MGCGAGGGPCPKPHNQLVIEPGLDRSFQLASLGGEGTGSSSFGPSGSWGLGLVEESSHDPSRSLTFPGLEPRNEGPPCLLLPAEPQELIITGFREIEACWEGPSSRLLLLRDSKG